MNGFFTWFCRHQGSDDSGYLGHQGEDTESCYNALNQPATDGLPVSNNRRWMLYKISKQSQDKLDVPVQDQDKQKKCLSAEGDSLSSRIESLNQGPGMCPEHPHGAGQSGCNTGSV